MPLKPTPRVVYKRNTLTAVVALMRFPTILRIQAEPPVAFQDRVRAECPVYSVIENAHFQLPADIPQDVQVAVRAGLQGALNIPTQKIHRFGTADGNWVVQLSQDSLALTCKVYPDWESFRERWLKAFTILMEIYKPAFAMTVALRYRNAIVRSQLGLANVTWGELLTPSIAAEFSSNELGEEEVLTSAHRLELSLGSLGRVRVQHGLGKYNPTGEAAYVIDNEYIVETQIGLTNVTACLDSFHEHSGRLYNFCVSDRLKECLGHR